MSAMERHADLGGERDYIDGAPIHCGQPIDFWQGGEWLEGRYEAHWVGGRIEQAVFCYQRNGRDAVLALEPGYRVRLAR